MNKGFWFNNTPTTRFIKIDNKKFKPFMNLNLPCTRCGGNVEKNPNCWIAQCKHCKTLVSFFAPTPVQQVAAICESTIIFNIGGYGSGKTTISSNIFSSMMRKIPGARLICIAQTLQQLVKNAIPELDMFFHPSEIERKTQESWYLKNGGVIDFWPSDDPGKLRSANANFIWIVEGNTAKMHMMYIEANARLRNQKGFVYEYNEKGEIVMETYSNGQTKPKILKVMNLLLVEANPEVGAWTNKAILEAHTIITTPSVKSLPVLETRAKPVRHLSVFTNKETNSDIVGILNATIDNPILPESYFINLKNNCKNESDYNRLVYCDITSQDGLVFPQVVAKPENFFVNIQSINLMKNDLVFVEGFDPGGSNSTNDPEGYLFGVFDKQFKKLQIIDGFKVSGMNLAESTKRIWDIRNKWGWNKQKHFAFVSDNAIGKASKQDRRFSLKNEYEIRLTTPVIPCNDKGIAHGIQQLNHWLDIGAIEFNSSLDFLKSEMFSYERYEKAKIVNSSQIVKYVESYTEVNNHVIDALRYLIVVLEGMGFRQDQHMIDYVNNIPQTPNREHGTIDDKFNIRRFLPGYSDAYDKPREKKFIKL